MNSRDPWKYWSWPALLFLMATCAKPATVEIRGAVMGTIYSIKVELVARQNRDQIAEEIRVRLDEINQALSNWEPDSDVSRFNRHQSEAPISISEHTARVARNALEIAERTGGAFDPTIGPLIEIWGFGAQGKTEFPSDQAIQAILAKTGYRNLTLEGGRLSKRVPELSLNFSANAKGYAVDQIAEYLAGLGLRRFMVEVGGEVRVSTSVESQKAWRIGIQNPRSNEELLHVALLMNESLATSGDYRNFFSKDGVRYSHVLDPSTGKPVRNQVASVSVIARDCMTADALATGLMVLDPEKAIALVERMTGVECLIVVREGETEFIERMSSGMARFLAPQQSP